MSDRQPALPQIRTVTSYQEVYNVIEAEILAGRLVLGDLLPTETALAGMLGVNRSTVREGLRLLEQTGLARRRAGRRLQVSRPHYAELSTRMSRAMVLHQIVFREVLELLAVLEPLAARLAAQRITAKQLEVLERNVAATEREAARGGALSDLDVEFHSLVADAAGNRALVMAREPVGLLLYPATDRVVRSLKQAPGRLAQAHRMVLEGLRSGDPDRAAHGMAQHIDDFGRGCRLAGLAPEDVVDTAGA